MKANNQALNRGRSISYLRAVRQDEEPEKMGLHPKNALAHSQPSEHVTHGSKPSTASQFTSLSEDPTVPLLWALPYGKVVVVAPVLASALHLRHGGGMFITNAQLLVVLSAFPAVVNAL